MTEPTDYDEEQDQADQQQQSEIDDNTAANEEQQSSIDQNTASNEAQQAQLDGISSGIAVEETALPSSNTPQGSQRRILLHAPGPEAIVTIGSKTGSSGDHGEDGINIGAADNLNITICADTNIYSGMRYVNTGTTVTEVSGGEMALSSADKYRLRTDKVVEITAGGAGPALESFDVLAGNTDGVAPPNIDSSSVRSGAETTLTVTDTVFNGLDIIAAFSGWKNVMADVVQASGLAAKISAGVALGIDTLKGAQAALSVKDFFGSDEGPSVKIHGVEGVSCTSDNKFTGYGTMGADIISPLFAAVKGGTAATLESPISSGVFGGVGASIASFMVTSVGGRYVGIDGKSGVAIDSGAHVAIAGPKVSIGANEFLISNKGRTSRATFDGLTFEVKAGSQFKVNAEQNVVMMGKTLVDISSDSKCVVRTKKAHMDMSDSMIEVKLGKSGLKVENKKTVLGKFKGKGSVTCDGKKVKVKASKVKVNGEKVEIG